jgi:hypothetical protein
MPYRCMYSLVRWSLSGLLSKLDTFELAILNILILESCCEIYLIIQSLS